MKIGIKKMKKRILNVGCGDSNYGTDFVDIYPSRKEIKKCDVSNEKLPYKSNLFDEVYCRFVFEHLKNPGFALKEMYRVLKKGGKIEIYTNNAGWIFFHNSKSKTKTHYGGYEKDPGVMEVRGGEDRHYGLYTFHHMKNHLEDVGFKEIKTGLYQKGTLRWEMELINLILKCSRFKWAAYPSIKATGIK